MGSFSTLVRQCVALLLLVFAFVAIAPEGAKGWLLALGVTALGFFLAVSLHRHRQVAKLTEEVDEVLHSGRRIDFTNCREGDVAALSNELGKMTARLSLTSEQLAQERNALADSLADVSHQIRTPLTAITLMLPAVERTDDPRERKRAVRELETMVDRVSWLVTALLKIAKVDAGAMPVERRQVRAADVVKRAVAPLETAMDLRDVTLVLDLDEGATFQGDAPWTAEAVENIVKNCMEHTPAGGMVQVTTREDALATTIAVDDTGSGIAPEDLPHVFERFYRGGHRVAATVEADLASGEPAGLDDAPTAVRGGWADEDVRQPMGFGIGLSLAQALVSAQGGTLRAENGPHGGAHFEIAFPKLVV